MQINLYDKNLYTALKKDLTTPDAPEFGGYISYGLQGHYMKETDTIVVSYCGHRTVEVFPDNSMVVFLAKANTHAALNRVSRWLNDRALYKVRTVTRASGVKIRQFSISENRYYNERYKKPEPLFYASINAATQVRLYPDGRMEALDLEQHDVTKDNTKYRAFNKQLKVLKALIVTKIKLNVFNKYLPDVSSGRWNSVDNKDELRRIYAPILGTRVSDTYFWASLEDKQAHTYKLICDWVDPETRSDVLVNDIAHCAFDLHRSESIDPKTNLIRRVTNLITFAQQTYLRKECVTIHGSNLVRLNADDTDRELQPTPGLREVPVPCEA